MAEIKGKVWNFGDNIDTDVIIPGRYLRTFNPKDLAEHVLEGERADFTKNVKQGDIILAGENFGCGSSREQAPVAIKAAGVEAIIAKSFARIFYRNSINIGLPVVVADIEKRMMGISYLLIWKRESLSMKPKILKLNSRLLKNS